MRSMLARLRGRTRDERGVEAAAMIIVLPMLMILLFGLIDIGLMIKTRMTIEAMARDTVRSAASQGGNFDPRGSWDGKERDDVLAAALYRDGKCTQSLCTSRPTVDCTSITSATSGATYRSNRAQRAGDTITCTVVYPYKPINGPILNSPVGLGIGSILKPFTISVTATAESGDLG